MNNSRTKNAARNIFFGFINKIIMLLFPFIIRTIMIKYLGSEYLGLNSLFTSILQVLNLAELGFSSAIIFSMYKPIAENDKQSICALMNLYKKIYLLIGIIIFIIGLLILPFLKYLIKGGYPLDLNIYLLFFLYIINTCITYLFFAYKSALFTAHQRTDITSNILTFTSIIQYALQIIIIIVLKNFYFYILANIITTLLNNIIIFYLANKKFPEYKCIGEVDEEIKHNIKIKVMGLMIHKICGTTRNSLDSIFISAFLGLNMVTLYSNYFLIINSLIGLFSIINTAIIAGVGNSIVIDSKEKNYNDMCQFNFIYMIVSGWATICLLCLYQTFIELWLGKAFLLPIGIVILLCIYFYTLKMGDIRGIYSDAKGLWWENRYRAICESIANLLLNYILVKIWGLYGVIIATLLSLFIINYIYGSQILFKNYFTHISILDYFKKNFIYLLVTIIIAIPTYFCCSVVNFSNLFIVFIIKGIICLLVPAFLYYFIYHKTEIFINSLKILKKIK